MDNELLSCIVKSYGKLLKEIASLKSEMTMLRKSITGQKVIKKISKNNKQLVKSKETKIDVAPITNVVKMKKGKPKATAIAENDANVNKVLHGQKATDNTMQNIVHKTTKKPKTISDKKLTMTANKDAQKTFADCDMQTNSTKQQLATGTLQDNVPVKRRKRSPRKAIMPDINTETILNALKEKRPANTQVPSQKTNENHSSKSQQAPRSIANTNDADIKTNDNACYRQQDNAIHISNKNGTIRHKKESGKIAKCKTRPIKHNSSGYRTPAPISTNNGLNKFFDSLQNDME